MNITAEESGAIVALLQSVAKWGKEAYQVQCLVGVTVSDTGFTSWLVQAHNKDYATAATLHEALESLHAKCDPNHLHETKMAELKELERRAEELRKELAKIPKT